MRIMTELLINDVVRYHQKFGRGSWAELGRLSGLSPVTIGKIARREVEPTLDSWNKLHAGAPDYIRTPSFELDPDDAPPGNFPRDLAQPDGIPLIGYVSAGEAIDWTDCQLATGQGLEIMPLPPEGGLHPNMYCVRVRGDSMLPMLKDGATLYVHPEQEVHNHDIVVYRDAGAAFVKRVGFSGTMVILKSLNPAYADIVKARSEALVLQKVVWIRP